MELMQLLIGGVAILVGFVAALAYIPLQIYTASTWRGIARTLALLPLLLMVPVFALTANAFAKQGNLWPIFLIFASPLGTGYLIMLMIIRRLANRSAPKVTRGSYSSF